ncbi:hypothetical protein [Lyngbya aestuarii]|uniref:hypothetical protein n=1 Tax=Lyngbya aestuarii TaxID=118322 RepID=UPI00403DD760
MAIASQIIKAISQGRVARVALHCSLTTLAGICLFLFSAENRPSGAWKLIPLQPAAAQFPRPQDVGEKVYESLPNLPLENQYVNKETGEVESGNTLIDRLVEYHLYVKNRPPNYRLDWKLTIADYLGAYEYLVSSSYPGNNTLQENPMEGDRAAIENLTRSERNALIDILVSIFNPNRPEATTSTPKTSPTPPANNSRPRLKLPEPGDAQLLLP